MKNYISVNAKYSKGSSISKISEHNARDSEIDYLLDIEDIQYQNKDITYNQNDESGGGSVNLDESNLGGVGTYSDNLKKMRSAKPSSKSKSLNLVNKFKSLQTKKANILRKKYNYKHNKNENEIVEMVVSLSEDQAKHYLKNGIDLMDGFNNFAKNVKDKYGFEPMGSNLHLDEGHKDKDGVVKLNIHAHIKFYNFDFNKNKTILRNMKKKDWEDIQTLAAKSFKEVGLDFVRGQSKGITKKEHLEKNDFVIAKQGLELQTILNVLDSKQNELKALYTTLNTQKNLLKDIRKNIDKNSNLYKVLSTNIKNLQNQEKQTRQQHKLLKNDLQIKKDELKIIDENIENQDAWISETKQGLKDFLNEHTTKNNNKYTINNINNFYDELVDLSLYLSKFDLKIEEVDKLKDNNIILFDKLNDITNSNNKNIEYIKSLENNLGVLKNNNILVENNEDLLEQNHKFKKFLSSKNLKNDYDKFTKEQQKEDNDNTRDMG